MPERTPTLLSIQEWADFIGLNPFYTYQIGQNIPDNTSHDCDYVFFEYPYMQSNHLSREDVRLAIENAEKLFADIAGYWPAPKYIVGESGEYPRYYHREQTNRYRTPQGTHKSIALKYGYVQSMGLETLTEQPQVITITLSDSDNDGVDDKFSFTATVPGGTLASQIAVFNTASDRNDEPLAEYEIKPISISISGTTATISGGIWLLVKPDLQNRLDPSSLDALDTSIYVTDLDVYTRTTDTDNQGSLRFYPHCADHEDCGYEDVTVCFFPRNKELGLVSPQMEMCYHWYGLYGEPYEYSANYYAGLARLDTGKMSRKASQIIAKLATALIPNRSCGCARADQRLAYYRDIPTDANGNLTVSQQTLEMVAGEFGVMGRGAIEAYMALQPIKQVKGVQFPA